MRHAILPLLALSLAATAAPAAAQFTGQSDISGPIVTGSGATGGSYQGSGLNVRHPVWMYDSKGFIGFTGWEVSCAVRASVDSLRVAHQEDRLRLLVDPGPGVDRARAAGALWALLDARPGAASTREAVESALLGRARGDEKYAHALDELLDALEGLFTLGGECPADRSTEPANAERWWRAFHEYDEFLESLPDSVLEDRPGELVILHSLLYPILEEAIRVGRQIDRRSRTFQ
ncbi:MAG TPA: hypothetical protein VFX98_13125 [Longimicrobiaceae bacterium]|nr:hypothetical protein [Longimicrobiaceae bacterium]